nr:MAG TPA: hypothetical protein [Bacteriophage sp.]
MFHFSSFILPPIKPIKSTWCKKCVIFDISSCKCREKTVKNYTLF